MDLWLRLIPLGLIVWNSYAIDWLIRLEKDDCQCSADWRRTFMKYYYFLVVINALLVVIGTRLPKSYIKFMLGLTAFFIGVALSYIYKLRDTGCDCSKSVQRNMIYIFSILQAIMILFLLVRLN
jgi:hypothetical protein